MSQQRVSKAEIRENWPHDTQPGWDMYSSQESDVSRVPCSLDVPLSQYPTSPILTGRSVVVPETPPMSRIEHITKNLEEEGYTVYVHRMADGKFMHLAFQIYDTEQAWYLIYFLLTA
jgi:hypothetical protein